MNIAPLSYKVIKLQHATLKREVFVLLGSIGGFHVSKPLEYTHVYTNSGIFPVSETPEQVEFLIKQAIAPAPEVKTGATISANSAEGN